MSICGEIMWLVFARGFRCRAGMVGNVPPGGVVCQAPCETIFRLRVQGVDEVVGERVPRGL